MLRAFSLVLIVSFAAPAAAIETPDQTVIAQQKPPAQTPKRDCERNSDGIS